jgi:hypothetical protein
MKQKKYLLFTVLVALSMLIASCGGEPPTQEPFILTAVAQTVIAKSAEQISTPFMTATPELTSTPLAFIPTLTALPVTITPTANVTGTSPCGKASLVSETIIDGTILKPGEKFIKTWEIKNASPCTWDTNYRIVFWDGNILGGAYYYNLPQPVAPGAVVPVSVVLTAPLEDGTYKSEWALQTPDKINFGVGEYSAPFYTEVVVTAEEKPKFGVTSVTYEMVREPPNGCPANVMYTAYATVETNGPLEFNYYWSQSDDHNVKGKVTKVDSATSIVLTNKWQLHIATTPGTRWMELNIGILVDETYQYTPYGKVYFTKTCGS